MFCLSHLSESCVNDKFYFNIIYFSTRVRAVLLAAGFFICYGIGSGPKTPTTIAFTHSQFAR